MIDVAFAAATRLAVGRPHRAHEIVERQPVVGAIAQRQVERQRNRAPIWVIRHRRRPVGAIDERPPSMNGAGSSSAERTSADPSATVSIRLVKVWRSTRRPHGCAPSPAVRVLREPFGQPELAGQIRAIEIERLQPPWTNALDVPAGRTRARPYRAGPRATRQSNRRTMTVLLRCSAPSPLAHGR